MSEPKQDIFEYLESTMQDVELPPLPEEQIERAVESAIDPIMGAKAIQLYTETQSPEAHERIIRKHSNLLNFIFMGEYLNSPTRIRVESEFGIPEAGQLEDMKGFLFELEEKGDIRASGRMNYFFHHYYTDNETGITRPILSLRMSSGAFLSENSNGTTPIEVPNYTVIPVTAITDYQIGSRVEE